MTKDVIPFHFGTKEVRTLQVANEPWFVGKDVAELLGYADTNNALKRHCRGEAKRYPIRDALGRPQEVRLIAEPDVWRLIVGSQLPEAERIERWIFKDVLPTIRRTGTYTMRQSGLSVADARAHHQRMQILRDLDAAPRPSAARRSALHEQLASVSTALGLSVPALEAFEPAAVPLPGAPVRALFWSAIDRCEAVGVQLNHARPSGLVSYHLKEVIERSQALGVTMPSLPELRKAVVLDPRYVHNRNVSSRLRRATTNCYTFRSVEAQAALNAIT